MRIKEIFNNIMLTPYEREQIEAAAKLTNLRVLDNRAYLKSYLVGQRIQIAVQIFLCVLIVPPFSWVVVWLPDKISTSLPMMILTIILGLIWIFIVFYKFCDILLSLIGFSAKNSTILLSLIMNAFLLTHLLFGSTFLSGGNQKFLQRLFTEFTLCKSEDLDFWIIFGVITVPLSLFIIFSLRNTKIFELENRIKYLDGFSILLAIVTFVFNISFTEVNIVGTFLFFLLIEILLTSFLVNRKLKKLQAEAEKIFREEILKTHPIYANLKRCYVFGGETYKDKMLSNEKFLKVILWNEEESFYTWKTFENYLEYKIYRYKQFQK